MEGINKGGIDENAVISAIAEGLDLFYKKLIDGLNSVDIKKIMKRKNPYLYRAKSMRTASEIIESVLSAYVSSSEETIFGNVFFEPVAIAAAGGQKSTTEGVDLVVQDTEHRVVYTIAVKSGTSVFNADSKKRQEENFTRAGKLARQGGLYQEAIIGYCYGKKKKSNRGSVKLYEELAGQEFWARLTGDDDFYVKLISYMEGLPEKYLEQYQESYAKASNRLIREFSAMFCKPDGAIDWTALVQFNSGAD